MAKKFNTILEELNELKKQLSEDYLFNGEEMPMGGEEMPSDGPGMAPSAHGEGHGDSEEEIAMRAQEIIRHEPIIGKIRETAIEGLKKYSDNPTSKIYEFFKKVFLDADKVLVDAGDSK